MASGDFDWGELVANLEDGELFVFGATGDLEKAIEDNNFAFGLKNVLGIGGCGDLDGGFLGDGVGHLGGEGAGANQAIEFAFVVVLAGLGDFDAGGANGFVGFLGGGGLGGETADFEVFFAEGGFDEVSGGGEGLAGKIEAVGAVVGDVAGLIESLGSVHSGASGKAEARVSLNLESSGGERWGGATSAWGGLAVGDGESTGEELFEVLASGLGGREGVIEGSRELGVSRGLEKSGNFEFELIFEIGDFLFALDDEAKSGRLDAAGRDGTWDFAAYDPREVEADEHVEGLAGLLGGDHVHIDGAGVLNGGLEGGLGDFVEGDAFSVWGEIENFEQVPRDGFAFAILIGSEPDGVGGFGGFLKLGDDFLVIGVDFVGDIEGIFVDFGVLANVANGGKNLKITTQILFDSMGFGGGLNDY